MNKNLTKNNKKIKLKKTFRLMKKLNKILIK